MWETQLKIIILERRVTGRARAWNGEIDIPGLWLTEPSPTTNSHAPCQQRCSPPCNSCLAADLGGHTASGHLVLINMIQGSKAMVS